MTTDARAGPDPTPCGVGLWGVFDTEDFGQAVYAQVVRSELARRLPAAHIRVFAPRGPERATREDRGEPAEALGPWSPARVAELSGQLDFVLVGGAEFAGADDAVDDGADDVGAERFLVEGLGPVGDDGPTVRWNVVDVEDEAMLRDAGVEGPIDVTPHPAVLLSRLIPAAVLAKRLEFLRVMAWYPREGGALVVQTDARLAPGIPELAGSLRQVLDDHPGLTPVLLDLDRRHGDAAFATALADALGERVYQLPSSVSQEDVAAAISASDGFIGSSRAGCLAALCYRRPWVALDDGTQEPDGLSEAFAHAVKSGAGDDRLGRLQAELDTYLDGIAAGAAGAGRARHGGHPPEPTRPALEAELRALRRAHRARSERANAERVMLADLVAGAEAEAAAARAEVEELRRRADQEAAARAHYEAECDALRRTRTFRWTASARSLYRKLGGGRR